MSGPTGDISSNEEGGDVITVSCRHSGCRASFRGHWAEKNRKHHEKTIKHGYCTASCEACALWPHQPPRTSAKFFCQYCNKEFNKGFNARRHEQTCATRIINSSIATQNALHNSDSQTNPQAGSAQLFADNNRLDLAAVAAAAAQSSLPLASNHPFPSFNLPNLSRTALPMPPLPTLFGPPQPPSNALRLEASGRRVSSDFNRVESLAEDRREQRVVERQQQALSQTTQSSPVPNLFPIQPFNFDPATLSLPTRPSPTNNTDNADKLLNSASPFALPLAWNQFFWRDVLAQVNQNELEKQHLRDAKALELLQQLYGREDISEDLLRLHRIVFLRPSAERPILPAPTMATATSAFESTSSSSTLPPSFATKDKEKNDNAST